MSVHCYLLTPGCLFYLISSPPSLLLSYSLPSLSRQPLSFPFASFLLISLSSHLLSSWRFQDDIGAAYSLVPSSSELHIWPDSSSNTHTRAHVIQMHINIQGQTDSDIHKHTHTEPEGTNKMNDKWHKWLEEGLSWISKDLVERTEWPFLVHSFCHQSFHHPAIDIHFQRMCDSWLKVSCVTWNHVCVCVLFYVCILVFVYM